MNWFFFSIIAAGLAVAAYHRLRPYLEPDDRTPAPRAHVGLRQDTPLDRMIAALKGEKDPLKRHRLLRGIVKESYSQRHSPAMNKVFHRFAAMHVNEAEKIAAAWTAAHGGKLPEVPGFRLLSIALEEEGRFDAAVSVCRKAVELKLTDGTAGGFGGRIKRLQKKRKQPNRKGSVRRRVRLDRADSVLDEGG